jgi:hypothetical protein
MNGGNIAEKSAELVHTRGIMKDAWKLKLKGRGLEGDDWQDTANAREYKAKEMRKHKQIYFSLIRLRRTLDMNRNASWESRFFSSVLICKGHKIIYFVHFRTYPNVRKQARYISFS